MGYRFSSGSGKDRFPALISKDQTLGADSLRAAIALFNHLKACSDRAATVADIMSATGLPAQRAQAALAALRAAGYVEADFAAAESSASAAPLDQPAAASPAAPRSRGRRRPGKGGKLKAGIMDYEWDLDHLIRAGDANIRGTGRRASSTGASVELEAPGGTGAPSWGPLTGEESQPPAIRFMVWLRFVLGPDEMAACDRFALAHEDQWSGWIERFSSAKAAGNEGELLVHIRRCLAEAASGDAAPPPPDPGPRMPRPN